MFGALRFIRFIMMSVILVVFSATVVSGNKGVVESVFQLYADLLKEFLIERDLENDGLESAFDYEKALSQEKTMALLEKQDALLADFDIARLDTREKAVAFWNNAYNYFMIAQILRDRPDGELVESVWDYGGRFNPFRANIFERDLFTVGKQKYSLDEIEKSILLGNDFAEKGWKEARVHFTVNCASVGCPPLRRQIYTTENIDALMTENTRRALNTHRHLHSDGNILYVSELFEWYEDDYAKEEGSVREFIKAYADDHVKEKMDATTRINYIDYDWSLNKPGNFPGFEEAFAELD
jgi:hypothetical protein